MCKEKIDFVITWVDGNDSNWLKAREQFLEAENDLNKASNYKDWDNLQYLFRGIEKFAPWVNKIYFVTYGHLPKWLNTNHEKLVIVKHEDFLKKENLPTFNINAIEINLHRIKGLSDKFVYFNDDTFLLQPITPEVFFKKGLPVNVAIANVMHEGVIAHIIVNNIDILNKNFNRYVGERLTKRERILKCFFKWFNFGYKFKWIPTLLLWRWSYTGFIDYHHPQPFLKRTFEDVWNREKEKLEKVSATRFRSSQDVNQYLFRYWQFAKCDFIPDLYDNAYRKRKYINIRVKQDAIKVAKDIKSKKFQMYCINDDTSKSRYTKEDMSKEDFEFCKNIIKDALDYLLPEKSSFEI